MPRRKEARRFIAIDGEAIDGKYAFIAAAGHGFEMGLWHRKETDELSTLDCLDFLFDVRAKTEGVYVAFGLNYDVNMILRDLSRHSLEKLWQEGEVWISRDGASFCLQWIPRKLFQVYSPDRKQKIRIYDVFGFFQSSFVKALEAWNIDDPFDTVKKMKLERARFTQQQRKEIEKYCLSECHLLVELMDKLEVSMRSANIFLRSYMGAGSAASAMLHREKVKAHRVSDTTFTPDVQRAIHGAYFGGRVEVMIQGVLNDVVNYDIVSAYPHQALGLPSLAGGRWRRARKAEADLTHLNALWLVSWDIPRDSPNRRFPMPFPLRRKNAIFYPMNGSGWYHHCELQAAKQLHADFITVEKGYVFEPANDEKPFTFVREYFAARQAAKARGDAAEKAYKLAINSLYGKLAQGISYKGEPPFRSLYWAGRITAGTRARLLDCASLHPLGVVSMATDGIVFTGDPGIETSKELGGFERTEIDELFIAQPGIYLMQTPDGQTIRKSRGFFTREIDYEDLREGWLREGPSYSQAAVCECGHVHNGKNCSRCECKTFSRRRRFIGLGTALARTDFSVWRTWQESDRILSLNSSRKFYANESPGRVARLKPPRFSDSLRSEPYVPKTRDPAELEALLELLQGSEQPLENEE